MTKQRLGFLEVPCRWLQRDRWAARVTSRWADLRSRAFSTFQCCKAEVSAQVVVQSGQAMGILDGARGQHFHAHRVHGGPEPSRSVRTFQECGLCLAAPASPTVGAPTACCNIF